MKTDDVLDLSLDSFAAVDSAHMDVIVGGRPSGWLWEFAGPGHEKALAQANRTARERLHRDRLIEQAQVNGRKWVAPEKTPTEVKAENVAYVVERLLGWSDIRIDGKDFPFTDANARMLLEDPRRAGVLAQALEFLAADGSFTQRSAKT